MRQETGQRHVGIGVWCTAPVTGSQGAGGWGGEGGFMADSNANVIK